MLKNKQIVVASIQFTELSAFSVKFTMILSRFDGIEAQT